FFYEAGGGFLGVALGALFANGGGNRPLTGLGSPTPRAKSVIFLFMCGGVSHIDTFDPKDNRWAGTLIDATGFGDNQAEIRPAVVPGATDRRLPRRERVGDAVSAGRGASTESQCPTRNDDRGARSADADALRFEP